MGSRIETAHSRSLLSGVLTATGRREEAQAQAERAVTRLSGDDVPADRRAAARFALAQALWSDDRSDRARAHALAQRALEDFGKFEPAGGHNSRAVRTWLEQHPR